MSVDTVTLKIPQPLYERIQELIEGTGFRSPTEFVLFELRDLAGAEPQDALGPVDGGGQVPEHVEGGPAHDGAVRPPGEGFVIRLDRDGVGSGRPVSEAEQERQATLADRTVDDNPPGVERAQGGF